MSPGLSLGHYRIHSKLGEGGMGAVYRATDTKLNREVALKVLPPSLADDSDRLSRFAREAQVLAALNHPNIAAIYGVEDRAIVMELVDGTEPRGPLPADEALPLIYQLIDALEYAHDKGIIHRDLKPANLKITPDQRLKVLDFGLAKALSPDAAAASTDSANSPTLTMRATMAGVIMGTAAYMSPEQARGHAVDKRADIWSFGVVVYELLTGRPLFAGETVSDTLASVLKTEPDLAAVTPRFHRLLRLCLTRDPRQRLRDISGARLLLEEIPAAAPARRTVLPWVIAAGAALAAVSMAGFEWLSPAPMLRAVRLTMPAPAGAEFLGFAPMLSPDGTKVVFVAESAGKIKLWLRGLDDSEARALPGTDEANNQFWAPDSRFLAFFADGKLKKIDTSGGPPVELCDVRSSRGGSWSTAGTILFTDGPTAVLKKVAASGGTPVPATEFDASRQEFSHRYPYFLPDGRHYLHLVRSSDPQKVGVYVGELDKKERSLVLRMPGTVQYAPPGYLLFLRDGMLLAQPFDTAAQRVSGEPRPLAEHVDFSATSSTSLFSASQNGAIAYFSGGASLDSQLTWVDLSGKPLGTFGPKGGRLSAIISPDGKLVAEDRQDAITGSFHVWVHDLTHSTDARLTTENNSASSLLWSPDSGSIVYGTMTGEGRRGAYIRPVGGTRPPELLFDDVGLLSDWSRDGRYIVFSRSRQNVQIWVMPMSGLQPGKPFVFLESTYDYQDGHLSPDGRWMAYVSRQTGKDEVFVQSFPDKTGEQRISVSGGVNPVWSPDGRRLYFQSGGSMMAADIKPGSRLEHDAPRQLFAIANPDGTSRHQFDVHPDGKRFLIRGVGAPPGSVRLNIILNWQSLLKK